MDFKNWIGGLVIIYIAWTSAGCTAGINSEHGDEYGIGSKPTAVSSLSVPNGEEPQSIVIFDKTVRRIHQFEASSLKHVKSLEVRNPGA
ncbi:MAG: hypothetical protein H7326_05545, partial [Bdellovibrionaceae bacterium]|nr:hypothetical protein [Pseudobdellovibrionaceae bacterium]